MKNLELLDIIGEVNEDYVLAAGDNVARPRFHWKTWAVCAACAALIAAAYPSYRASLPQGPSSDSISGVEDAPEATLALIQRPGLHEYTLADGGVTAIPTQGTAKTPEGGGSAVPGQGVPVPEPAQPPRGDGPSNTAGGAYMGGMDGDAAIGVPAQNEAAAQDEASAQYERLLQGMGLYGEGKLSTYPDWFAGAWIDGEKLIVAIVEEYRTSELEQRIREWTEGDIVFQDAKYSQNYLDNLMKEINRVFDQLDCHIFLSYGVYPTDNRIHLDFFEVPSDEVLAALAGIDPDGDAIYIQVFTGIRNVPTDGSAKGPASDPVEPSIEAEPTPVPADGPAAAAEPSVPPAP